MITEAQRVAGEHASPPRPNARPLRDANVGSGERAVSTATGVALLGLALKQRGIIGAGCALAAAGLLWHGSKRHSKVYSALGISSEDAGTFSNPLSRDVRSRASITINKPAKDLHAAWRDLPSLARFFPRVESVEELDDTRSRWTIRIPSGKSFTWTAAITQDEEGERIAWESEQGAPFRHRGRIDFREALGGRGTAVTLELHYHLPAGIIGVLAAKAQGADPQDEATEALRRFKQWIETGEIATNRGPAARGSGMTSGSTRQAVFKDTPARTGTASTSGPRDRVDEASDESFPASDPPSYTGATATPSTDRP